MPQFLYKAKDAKGKSLKGLVEATVLKQAINLLHEKGFYIIQIKENTSSKIFQSSSGFKMSFTDLVHFTRQLSTMITAGLTLVESLTILSQQVTKPAIIKFVGQIEEEVKGGRTFGEVLQKYPRVFPPIYLALVKAGEASGKLDVILSRLAENLEKSKAFKGKIRGAMMYPSIVMGGMLLVATIVMTVVVPRLTSLYKEFGVDLPLPTKILITVSDFVIHTWWLVLIIGVVCVSAFLKWKETNFGKHFLAMAALKAPVFGNLTKESTLVELTRTLSMLIDGGVPILTALSIAQDATGNVLFKEAFAQAAKKVEKGFSLSDPLSENKMFPPILGQMVMVGEETGKLGDSLLKLSKYFETEADTAVNSLTTMLEPLIMIILGVGVGFLVIAVLMPIYSLTSKF